MQTNTLHRTSVLILALAALLTTACNKDKGATLTLPTTGTIVQNLKADGEQYTLFSLRENGLVANTDSATNKWDIGFKKTTLIINGGTLRTGAGGAFVHLGDFDALKTIADTATFRTDKDVESLAIKPGSGNGWYNYSPLTNTVLPITGRILVVRTANGNFAKLEILSYYKNIPKIPTIRDDARFYTFRYTYQPNGTKNFD